GVFPYARSRLTYTERNARALQCLLVYREVGTPAASYKHPVRTEVQLRMLRGKWGGGTSSPPPRKAQTYLLCHPSLSTSETSASTEAFLDM
ncbi:hypothetical protein CSUI_007522, partial [Cystoisospora suis]